MSKKQVSRTPIQCIKGKCFVTGQSCTHKSQIQRIRNEKHNDRIVSVFVVMSFTGLGFSMYDMYIHELRHLIQSHCCFKKKHDTFTLLIEKEPIKFNDDSTNSLCRVSDVDFMRADLEISTGHVICNRVCDPIQRADLIVIDVSHPNPNVFYELGLAMSMGKHVLPICFSKKYYYMIPDSEAKTPNDHNIECFPWMKELYQFFSLYCYAISSPKKYPLFFESKERSNYIQYSFTSFKDYYDVAQIMYALLSEGISYEESKETSAKDTLMLYSEKGFENRNQFSTVIQNMDQVVNAVSNPELFRGDRIIVLAQDDKLFEQDKDKPTGSPIGYNVADITKYGINKAIKRLTKNIVYHDPQEQDYLPNDESLYSPPHSPTFIAYGRSPLFMERIRQCAHYELKFFAHNIAYASQDDVTNADIRKYFGSKGGLLLDQISSIYDTDNHGHENEIPELHTPTYTYLNVMVTYMRYVNQVFIDTHANDVVSYFWLGVCHASGVDTVRIERNYTEADQKLEESKKTFDKDVDREIQYFKSIRSVFDVAGLWCAYINANNIDNFFEQLYQVEVGIYELHHALMKAPFIGESNDKPKEELNETKKKETPCERYYRHRFWQDMCQDSLAFFMGCTLDKQESADASKRPSPANGSEQHEFKRDSSSQKNIRWNIGAWDQITSTILTKQMLHYQKSNLLNVIISPSRATSSIPDSASFTPETNCTIYIGDDKINPGCNRFIGSIRLHKVTDQNNNRLFYIDHDVQQSTENNTDIPQASCSDFVYRCLNSTNENLKAIFWSYPSYKCFKCLNKLECNCFTYNNDEAFSYTSYGGLFLHHWIDKKVDLPVCHNDVYIMGGNGITTYAMASIFVDQDLRKNVLMCSSDSSLLKELQQLIRNSYINEFCERLKKLPIILDCEKFGISFSDENSVYGDKNSMTDVMEKIKQHVSKLLAPYFLPFISYCECSGLRRSLELYLQEFFGRDMRNQSQSVMQIEEKDIQDANQSNSEPDKSLSELHDLVAKGKEFWGSYTHNIVIDYLIQKIIDVFMNPLENGCYVEAICKVGVSQYTLENRENPWQTIKKCGISLASSHFVIAKSSSDTE